MQNLEHLKSPKSSDLFGTLSIIMEAPSSFGPLVFLNPTNRNMKLSLSYGPLQDKFQKKLMAVSDANCLGAFRKGAHFAMILVRRLTASRCTRPGHHCSHGGPHQAWTQGHRQPKALGLPFQELEAVV